MAADIADVADPSTPSTPSPLRRLGRSGLWFLGITVAQAVWLAVLMDRGWFYQDDITFLAQADGRTLGLRYLTDPVNDHLTPGLRLAFWLLHPLGLEHHWVTIALRVVLQAAATLLLARLLVRLVGDRVLVRWVIAGYAFSPLLLGPLWLSCAMNVLPAQIFVLLGFTAHVRYTRSGRLRSAAWTGIAFVLAAMFWELSAVDLLLLPLLSIGFLHSGSRRERLRAMLSRWPGWLLTLGPTAAFAIGYAVGGYGSSARSVGVGTLFGAWWREWVQTVAPMSLGGPWKWITIRGVYFSATATPIAAMCVAQAIFIAAVALSVRRTGWTALMAWALPLVSVALTATIVVIGRFQLFGYLSMRQITYAFDAAIPLAMAVCLAFLGPAPEITSAAAPHAQPSSRAGRHAFTVVAVLAVLTVGGAAISAVRFTVRWHQNPTEPFMTTLARELDGKSPVELLDTPLPTAVLPVIDPNRYLSDVLPLIGASAKTASNGPNPMIVNQTGRIVDTGFLQAASAAIPPASFCGDLYHGPVDRKHTLVERPDANGYFVKIDYFQRRPTVVYVTMIDSHGRELLPTSGSRVVLDGQLATQYLRFPNAAPIAVRIRTTADDANMCVTGVAVGTPLPRTPR